MASDIDCKDNVIPNNIDKASKNMLSASEYNHMLDSTDEGVVLIQDGGLVYVNAAITRLLGYSVEEAIGMSFSSLIGPEHLELVVERYMARLQGEDVPSTYDITLKMKDGTIVPVEIHSSMFQHNGSPASLVMVRGIAKRKESEEKLIASEKQFRTITEHSPDAIFITDQKGNYLYVNQAASDLLGYSVEKLITMKISDISEIARRGEAIMQFQKLMKEGALFAELSLVRKDGSVIPSDINAVVLPNGLVYGSCRGLTEQKKAEKILKSKVDELESYKKATIGRELKMVELKEEILSLKEKHRGG